MAHRGRMYPLNPIRGLNGDAPYPRWAARRYEIWMPDATGTLAPYLSSIIVTLEDSQLTPQGLVYTGNQTIISLTMIVHYKFGLLWDNDPVAPRINALELTFTRTLPPDSGTIATWATRFGPTAQLSSGQAAIGTLPDPTAYSTGGNFQFHALNWDGEPV